MFSKTEKKLHDDNNFNPPPGYYSNNSYLQSKNHNSNVPSFARQDRFGDGKNDQNPGPGAYYKDRAQKIRKRLIQDSKRRQAYQKPSGQSEIKISSIPSIPKKSATRVYEQLAPGILILHEQENQNSSIGPGTYNINPNIGHKKTVAHKINPEHKKKQPPPEPEIKIPTIAEEIRNQKRMMYKKNVIKTTVANKNMISPSDLCLQVIILRERLMRSDQNPAPGAYYNEKYQSGFKEPDPDLQPQYQLMMGKQQRFKNSQNPISVGPGSYEPEFMIQKNPGGFISKEQRKIHSQNKNIPGPGSYKVEYVKAEALDPKGNYPPIFGSGCNRFYSADKRTDATPGPGSYKIDGPRKKKQKFIKVKKNFYESQFVKPSKNSENNQDLFSVGGDKSRSYEQSMYDNKTKRNKNNHYFTSKVERFKSSDKSSNPVGPGNYDSNISGFMRQSYNKKKDLYTGSKQPRFEDAMVRPNLGPGAYFREEALKKQ